MDTRYALAVAALFVALFAGGAFLLARDDGVGPGGPQGSGAPSIAPTVTATASIPPGSIPASACGNESQVVADPAFREPGSLTGDVDGEGASDTVFLAADRAAPAGCQGFVAVQTATGLLSNAIPVDEAGFDLDYPRLDRLVEIDVRDGLEIVVQVNAAASAQFVTVFTAVDGGLQPVDAKGPSAPTQDTFAYGGSAGRFDAVDCAVDAGAGAVWLSAAVQTAGGTDYRVTRRLFRTRAEDNSWVEDASGEQEVTVTAEGLSRFAEFANSPFRSCSVPE